MIHVVWDWNGTLVEDLPVVVESVNAALDAIGETLERGEQVMVFLNRRGYSPVLMCQSCGWHGLCERREAKQGQKGRLSEDLE